MKLKKEREDRETTDNYWMIETDDPSDAEKIFTTTKKEKQNYKKYFSDSFLI